MKRLQAPKGMGKEDRDLLLKNNSRLAALLLSAERAYDLLRSQGHSPTPATIRQLLRGKPLVVRRLTDALDLLADAKRAKGMQEATIKTIGAVRAALLPYLQKQHTQALPLASVTVEWLRGWERWLIQQGYAVVSIRFYISTVLQAMREASHEGWIAGSLVPDYRYQSAAYEPQKRALSFEEIERVQAALPELPAGLRMSGTMFVFCCYTGLSYVDYCRVAHEPTVFFVLTEHPVTHQLVRGIQLVRQKVQRKNAETWIPMLPPATAFLDSLSEALPTRAPSSLNPDLKVIALRLALSVLDLKFKDARSTFAQWTRAKLGRGTSAKLAQHTEKIAERNYSSETTEELLRTLHVLGAELSYN